MAERSSRATEQGQIEDDPPPKKNAAMHKTRDTVRSLCGATGELSLPLLLSLPKNAVSQRD